MKRDKKAVPIALLFIFLIGCSSVQTMNTSQASDKELILTYIDNLYAKEYWQAWSMLSKRFRGDLGSYDQWVQPKLIVDSVFHEYEKKIIKKSVRGNEFFFVDVVYNRRTPDKRTYFMNKIYFVVEDGFIDLISEYPARELEGKPDEEA